MVFVGVSTSVTLIVVEQTEFKVVLVLLVTFVNFEYLQKLFQNLMVFFRVILETAQLAR